jgi:2-dehydropantoate 2-reductase
MKIGIIGLGGVGGYFGGRLAASGRDVVFIVREETAAALRGKPLQVESINGDFRIEAPRFSSRCEDLEDRDLIIVATKTWQVDEIARTCLAGHVAEDALILPLQNGVEASSIIASHIGEDRVLIGLCAIIAFKEGPGRIRHTGIDPFIRFGSPSGETSPRLEEIKEMFTASGIKAEIPASSLVALWDKFLLVVSWGTVSALANATAGEIRKQPRTASLLREAMDEIAAVAAARGITLNPETAWKFWNTVPDAGTTSLQRDIAEGRPSELEHWTGAVVRLAEESGVDVPIHRVAYACLLPRAATVAASES